MDDKNTKFLYAVALLFIIFSGIFIYGNLMNADIMEARNFITAREMVQDHNWLLPTLNGETRIAKPPLPTWMTAVMMIIAGTDTNYTLNRFPSGLSGLLLLYFIYSFVSSATKCKKTAVYAVIALSTSYLFMFMSRRGTWDIHCNTFMVGAIWMLYEGMKREAQKAKYFVLSGFLMGLSWMSKGPVAFYAMLLPVVIAHGFVYRFEGVRKNIKWLAVAVIVCLVVSSAWPLYLLIHEAQAAKNVVGQESTAWFNRHQQPFWYYIIFPSTMGVWLFMTIPLFWVNYFKTKLEFTKQYKFLIITIITTILLLSIFPEKKDKYLLPATIVMSAVLGIYLKYLENIIAGRVSDRVSSIILKIYHVFGIFLGFMGLVGAGYYTYRYSFEPFLLIAAFFNVYFIYLFIKSRRVGNGFRYFLLFALLISVTVCSVLPLVRQLMTQKDYTVLFNLRGNEYIEKYDIYATRFNVKAIWAVGKKMHIVNKRTVLTEINSFPAVILTEHKVNNSLMPEVKLTTIMVLDNPENDVKWKLILAEKQP